MFSFRQQILLSYLGVFLLVVLSVSPFVVHWVEGIVRQSMEASATEIIAKIHDAPSHEALVQRLKDQKSLMFFRSSIITDEHKVLYDSHAKRILGPKFSQDYVAVHPEVVEAMDVGSGYREGYSEILHQEFAYFAKAFDFRGKHYVLRTGYPYAYIKGLVRDFEMGFIGLAVLILLLFSSMTWFVIHYLTRPIQEIINVVKPYQEGAQHMLPIIKLNKANVNDDFCKLANTLNSLSLKIQSHIDLVTKERNEKETILDSLAEGVIAVSDEMQVTYINPMALRLMDCPKEVSGHSLSLLHQEKCEKMIHQCQEEKQPVHETLAINREGKKLYLDIVAAPKKDHAGAVLVLQDKTEHHKLFEMRRDFVANASHELKTPITIIRGFAEALQDNPDLALQTRQEVIEKIMRNCSRMGALIKDLLILADVENIPSSRFSHIALRELAEECKQTVLEAHPTANIDILEESTGTFVCADRDLLQLALINLIENAAKYSRPPAQITVNLQKLGDDEVVIQVSDKGIGIPSSDIEHIFDRFYTVDKAHSQKMGGSGLGLSIVKTIVEKHAGTISAESTVGKGSTFVIHLPVGTESVYTEQSQ